MRQYRLSATELDTMERLTRSIADVPHVRLRRMSFGWPGARWVRYVAQHEGASPVGYADLEDLLLAVGLPLDSELEWADADVASINARLAALEAYSSYGLAVGRH